MINTGALRLEKNMIVGGLATDVEVAGRWGIVSGHSTTNALNQLETGNGMPKQVNGGSFIRNNGSPLGYLPVMSDTTKATTFDDLGSELKIFDTTNDSFVFRYVDVGRNKSLLAVEGQVVDLGDWTPAQTIVRGSGPEQIFVRGNFLFVAHMHSDNVEVFRIDAAASNLRLSDADGHRVYRRHYARRYRRVSRWSHVFVTNRQTEDVSFLSVDGNGGLHAMGTLQSE